MPRDGSMNRQMRLRIAQLAARLIAEDGIDDYGLAKRKAARQAGAPETRNLPDNDEVEQALREYLEIYQAGTRTERLEDLRREALELMQLLAPFDPHLVGAVLSGSVGKYAAVELQLFTDDPKTLELFLINRGIQFRTREGRFWVAGEMRQVPVYELEDADTNARLAVFGSHDVRHPIRPSQDGRPMERVRPTWVADQLAAPRGDDRT